MGFPAWTLWGMGVTAVLALISLVLALLGQSPKFLRQSGLSGARLDYRVRTFTAIAFACLLLAFGFFVAGVPIGDQAASLASTQDGDPLAVTLPAASPVIADLDDLTINEPETTITMTRATPATGAFDGPPGSISEGQQSQTAEAEETLVPNEESSPVPQNTPTVESSATAMPTTSPVATSTPTPSPTFTPTPSLTPTPILDETIQIGTSGSTVWLRRSPGGQNLVLVTDGDFVIILNGHANQGGVLWSEVKTLEGVSGWLQEEFLLLDE